MHRNVLINWSIEFGPIAVFFLILYFLGNSDKGFIFATALFTLLTAAALVAAYYRDKRIALFPLIAGASVIFFGCITVLVMNPLIFIVKDSFYNGFFAVLLLGGVWFRKGMLKPLFGSLFDIKDKGWYVLSLRWGIMFLFLTIANEIVWRIFGRDAWIMYKFWSTIVTVVFGFYQITLSKKYRNDSATAWGMRIVSMHREKLPGAV